MTRFLALLACFLVIVACASALAPEDSHPGVIDLTPKNFDSVVGQDANVLVEFYAPWCGHCKRLAETYGKLGEALQKSKSKDTFKVAKVNADEHKELSSRFGVKGFPTLKFFPAGQTEPEDYNGGRDLEDFVSFLSGKGAKIFIPVAPSDVIDLNPTNFEKVVKDTNTHRFVEFYAPWCGHCKQLAPTWEKLATTFKPEEAVVVAKLNADKYRDLASEYGISGFPTLKFFPKGQEKPESFDGQRTLEGLVSYLNEKTSSFRSQDGGLNEQAGRIEKLDELAKEFLAAAEKSEVVNKATEIAEQAEETVKKAADYYVRVMKKVIEKGEGYVAKEKARLAKILSSGNASRERMDSFQLRHNVLNAF